MLSDTTKKFSLTLRACGSSGFLALAIKSIAAEYVNTLSAPSHGYPLFENWP